MKPGQYPAIAKFGLLIIVTVSIYESGLIWKHIRSLPFEYLYGCQKMTSDFYKELKEKAEKALCDQNCADKAQ